LLNAKGGFDVEVAAMVEFLGGNLHDWWEYLDSWVWISFDDKTAEWIGAEVGAQTMGPDDDHDALELFRIARKLEPFRP